MFPDGGLHPARFGGLAGDRVQGLWRFAPRRDPGMDRHFRPACRAENEGRRKRRFLPTEVENTREGVFDFANRIAVRPLCQRPWAGLKPGPPFCCPREMLRMGVCDRTHYIEEAFEGGP